MNRLRKDIKKAVQQFWSSRLAQGTKQGTDEDKDRGGRSEVTGGGHLAGFVTVICDALEAAGLERVFIFSESKLELPGFFRPTKEWDLLVVADGHLVAVIECKSQVGPSFGNNFNNRTEEAIGNAHDLWIAFREGAFGNSVRPWLGWFMLLEDCDASKRPVKVVEPHFPVFPEFQGASYARRYELLCERLMRERLYDAACIMLSPRTGITDGAYSDVSESTSLDGFLASLAGKAAEIVAKQRLKKN